MEYIVGELLKDARDAQNRDAVEHLWNVRQMLVNPNPDRQPDWDEVAALWLDLIRPVWFEKLRTKKRKPLLLKDVRCDLLAQQDWLIEAILNHFAQFPVLPGPETRIRACIIGVPSNVSS